MSAIGVIGLGQMGLPIAESLIEAGFEVVGYRRQGSERLKELGGVVASSAREVAERCEITLSCIPDDRALDDVVSGPKGFAGGDCSGRVLIELSTLGVETKKIQAQALTSKGGTMLDCAISGLPQMVKERRCVIFAGGEEWALEKARPVLEVVTPKVFFMGGFGTAVQAKLCNNMLVAINIASTAEMLAFGVRLGIDPLKLVEALREGSGGSLQFTARAAKMAQGDWNRVMGSTAMLTKDVHLIEDLGAETGCPMPILATAAKTYEEAIAAGYGDLDVASIYAIAAQKAGIVVPRDLQ